MLSLENINISVGNFRIKDLSLQLQEGRCHVLVGTTGSGKTMLLETVVGLRQMQSGTVAFAGRDLTSVSPENRFISYLPQDLCLFPNLNVRDNVLFGLRMRNVPAGESEERLARLAVSMDISHLLEREVENLSGGEKHRVALARAIIAENSLVLLDEPFSSLNLGLKRKLWNLLRRMQRQNNLTLLLVTHDLEEALFLGDDLSLIANGKLLESGPASEVFCAPKSVSAACILGTENFINVSYAGGDGEHHLFKSDKLNFTFKVRSSYPSFFGADFATANFCIGIRAADIHINHQNMSSDGLIMKIEDIQSKGPRSQLLLSDDSGEFSLSAEISMDALDGLEIGKKISVDFRSENLMALLV